jgi:hypothetical protein
MMDVIHLHELGKLFEPAAYAIFARRLIDVRGDAMLVDECVPGVDVANLRMRVEDRKLPADGVWTQAVVVRIKEPDDFTARECQPFVRRTSVAKVLGVANDSDSRFVSISFEYAWCIVG